MTYENPSYWKELHRATPGRLRAVGYPELGDGFNRAAYRLRLRAVERLLRRAGLVSPESVLEGAVGIGAYSPLWERLGVERWVGVDISPQAVAEVARRFPGHHFHVADLTRLDEVPALAAARFHMVTAIDVLYHLVPADAFARALTGLAERVKPGGFLLVSDVFCEVERQIAPHVIRRPLAAYQALLEPRGFSLVDREPVFAVLGDPVRRPSRPLLDGVLFNTWRVAAKLVRVTPAPLRDPLGWAVATSLWPLDAALRALGVARGANLELALFRRRPKSSPGGGG